MKVKGNSEQVKETGRRNIDTEEEIIPPFKEEENVREVTPEDEEILVDGALMTAKSIQARTRLWTKKNKYQQIRRVDQSDIEKNKYVADSPKTKEPSPPLTNISKKPIPIATVSDKKLKKEALPSETQRRKIAKLAKNGTTLSRLPKNFLTIDQLTIIVPQSRKGYKYAEKPGLFCSVS
eukprot:TRINITY_DN35954_c0_g1_i1.p1 TRINITY_DN35954_c0_g1~~TRINITY_DN35954_c0_g1_i1.p1  ORF type:complete len:179 (+),score=48.37 TRINITY_DN35954_c0_g1_i1:222-758(+)